MPKVSEAHRVERRQQILEGARRAFSQDGYFGTNVSRLEEATGLSRGAIFSYFPSKLDLFLALAQEDRGTIGRMWLEEGFEAVLRAMAGEWTEWAGVYLDVARMLRSDAELRDRWTKMLPEVMGGIEDRYAEQYRAGAIRTDVPLDTIGIFLGVVLDGLAIQVGAGLAENIDVDGLLKLVQSALAPK